MKKIGYFLAAAFFLLSFHVAPVFCVPIDLSGFMGDATKSGGTITFIDDFTQQWYAYYDPSYDVANDAGILSFDYSLDLVPDTINDYLTLEIDYLPVITITTEGSGDLSYDMLPYRGQSIDLAWVLYWGGDNDAGGSMATISNIDLTTIPEPASILLIGAGMFGLFSFKRKKS
ncbi:MAG: PEP-CTERM sorting domain-containing protein [Desulfobacterales bacterium]|nr:PEP-CTERM sorting domain-containing protein [Desulfobacterales bacterium]